jgi:glycosyltransferase involved in cell wall biosynthesis
VTTPVTISAIMPVRNCVGSVRRALESIMAQSRPVDEIVVVDGRSSDGTIEVLRSFPKAAVITQPDDGLAAARNLGLAHATGSVVAFLDADDSWEPAKTETQVDLFADDSVEVVAGMMRRVRLGEHATPSFETIPALTPGGLLIRRRVFDVVGEFDTRYQIAADTEWLMRVREAGLGPTLHAELVLHKGVRVDALSRDVHQYRAELLRVARDAARRSATRESE